MASRDTIAVIAEELALAFQPLQAALSSPGALLDFLADLGWDFATPPAELNSLGPAIGHPLSLATTADTMNPAQIAQLIDGIRTAFKTIADLGSAAGLAGDFRAEFPRQVIDYVVVEYLLNQQPRWGYLLVAFGVLRLEAVPAQGGRLAYIRRTVAFEDFGDFIDDPLVFFRNSYRWGQSNFDGDRMVASFYQLLQAWHFAIREHVHDAATLDRLNDDALQPDAVFDASLRLVFAEDTLEPATFGAGVGLFLLPETPADKPGFAFLPYATGAFEQERPIAENLTLALKAGVDLTGGLGVLVRPDKDVEFFTGFASGTLSSASGNLSVLLKLGRAGEPILAIGTTDASRFEFGGISTEGGTRFHSGGKFEAFAEFALQQGKIVVKPAPDERDGFLAKLLPSEGLQITCDLVVGLSTTQGVYFGGSGGLEIAIPAHIQLGPIEIMSALLAVRFKDGGIPVELAATIKGDFGVLKATVENIGVTATFSFPADRKGNLGPVNLALGFRPPNGVALAVDAGVIKGGGYLYLDFAKGEYAGALELTFNGFLSLKAIGLINTKLPSGQPGFSLLIIITAEFVPGFQLGFGFTLVGVGGLLGLNRAVLLDPLAIAGRTGAAHNLPFPTNVIANAPRIISDLRVIFPPQEGKFLVGPMAKLGWGTPTLISASLGIIIEIPGNVVILGRLRVTLPTEEAPLILLQVTFVGALEFDKRRIWFFASLYESRILFITIDGEVGLLMDFGDQPNFVLAVGGFHPRFPAPALPFPSPKRISIN